MTQNRLKSKARRRAFPNAVTAAAWKRRIGFRHRAARRNRSQCLNRDVRRTCLAIAERHDHIPNSFQSIFRLFRDDVWCLVIGFIWLEKVFQDRSFFLIWLKVEPLFDDLRDDTRFQNLLRRIGLPE